jgi:hypothetical protein
VQFPVDYHDMVDVDTTHEKVAVRVIQRQIHRFASLAWQGELGLVLVATVQHDDMADLVNLLGLCAFEQYVDLLLPFIFVGTRKFDLYQFMLAQRQPELFGYRCRGALRAEHDDGFQVVSQATQIADLRG